MYVHYYSNTPIMSPSYKFLPESVLKDERITKEVLDGLKLWCIENRFPLSEEQLILFLLGCDNNVENTRKRIETYITCRKELPEFFSNRHTEAVDVQNAMKFCDFALLPVRTEENNAIIITRLKDTNYFDYCLEEPMKLFFMIEDMAHYKNPPNGIIIVFDLKGTSLYHLAKLKPRCIHKFHVALQEAIPSKIVKLFIINPVWFLDKILVLARPFIKKGLYDKIYFYNQNDFFEFFENYVPREYFPNDYGGILPTLKVLSLRCYEELRKMNSFFEAQEKQLKSIEIEK